MENFTDEQLVTLAHLWRIAAQMLHEFQGKRWANLSVEQHLDINAYQNSLLNRANDLETGHVRAIINDALPAYNAILKAANGAIATLRNGKELNIGLNIGAMIVALAAAVARGHLKSIDVALRELEDLQAMI